MGTEASQRRRFALFRVGFCLSLFVEPGNPHAATLLARRGPRVDDGWAHRASNSGNLMLAAV